MPIPNHRNFIEYAARRIGLSSELADISKIIPQGETSEMIRKYWETGVAEDLTAIPPVSSTLSAVSDYGR